MSNIDSNALGEIKLFLEGYNNDLKYITNVEADPDKNYAECVIRKPNCDPVIERIPYIPFLHMKDLALCGKQLYKDFHIKGINEEKMSAYGITITKLKTGNQKRLANGYCYKVESSKSYNSIINYLKDGGLDPYAKAFDKNGKPLRDEKGWYTYKNRDLFNSVKPYEQFFISTKSRLFKGIEEYKNLVRMTLDIETSGLRYAMSRVFAIGVRTNHGLDIIIEAKILDDDESERQLITELFSVIVMQCPDVIVGHNSEVFDWDYILGRAKLLNLDLYKIQTTLRKEVPIKRIPNVSVKYGNQADKFTATAIWGTTVIDTLHAAKRTAAVNSEIKKTALKYIAKFEKFARPNRTYINGEGNDIFYFYKRDNIFCIDEKNNYIQIPKEFQEVAKNIFTIQSYRGKTTKFTDEQLNDRIKIKYAENPEFTKWYREEAKPKGMNRFINGKALTKQYLSDDLWETEQVDELYNQSSFLLAKIVPTNYQRICTMGTAAVWNLLMTAWSYENDVAIPFSEKKDGFSGGLARTFKTGFSENWVKIDYASLYPMIQLTDDIFPMFDITGVIKKMLLYLTTTRNIYKKLANYDPLEDSEVELMKSIDHESYLKYVSDTFTAEDRALFKVKQLPIKILNNSLFGALGSGIAFNWSDNVCAARITCSGRLHLRHAIDWFGKFGCTALLAVTDGINFKIPIKTKFHFGLDGVVTILDEEIPVEEAWMFAGKKKLLTGVAALIQKFNAEEMKPPYMSVDNDGEFLSCLNLARINYATLSLSKNKKTQEMEEKIKLTGNSIKSKIMPEYIDDFLDKGLSMILHGQGVEFVNHYNSYVEEIFYGRIPLKKIASKSRVKCSLKQYVNRGLNKNGKPKGKQAHMELLLDKRMKIANELFEKHKDGIIFPKIGEITDEKKMQLVADYMPPEPEMDSVVYIVNIAEKKGASSSGRDANNEFNAMIITNEELEKNPDMLGRYNALKYLEGFNKKVMSLLVGFDPEIRKRIVNCVKQEPIMLNGKKTKVKRSFLDPYLPLTEELELKSFDLDSLEGAMVLEEKEADFWNKTGYNPYLTWDGFKTSEEHPLHMEVYENALNFVNEKMKEVGKAPIKSINDKYEKDDLVLIKNDFIFTIGQYDGVYLKIIKTVENIPKTPYQIEREERELLLREKLGELNIDPNGVSLLKMNKEDYFDKKMKFYQDFLVELKINKIPYSEFCEIENAEEALAIYIDMHDTIIDVDDLDDDIES